MSGIYCCIHGCTNNGRKKDKETPVRYFRIPAVITREGEETEELTRERQLAWLKAINRKELTTSEAKKPWLRVCSEHFKEGKPAYKELRNHPDWAPTLKLGSSEKVYSQSYERRQKRKMLRTLKTDSSINKHFGVVEEFPETAANMDDTASPNAVRVSMPDPTSETENSKGASNSQDVQVKEEPEDDGYEHASSTNSRTSSPLQPLHFGITSPQQNNASPSTERSENESSNHHTPQHSSSTNSVGSHSHGAKVEKKINTVQNIVEGLRRKNETQLAKNNSAEPSLNSYRSKATLDGVLKKHEPAFPPSGQSSIFPISQNLQARLTQDKTNGPNQLKPCIARPKSPTSKSHALLKDRTHFSYAMMQSAVDEQEAAEIFKVQNHELVCAIGSKSLVSSNSNKVIASLDSGYYWCNFCPYTANNKTSLIQHILDHRFSCKYCPYESFCRSDTIRHMHKMHSDFEDSARHFVYCTLLSDFMRIKARLKGKVDKDPDEDVGDPYIMEAEVPGVHLAARKRKLPEDSSSEVKSARSSTESPCATPTLSDSESSVKEKGKSRKSQNPKKHAPPNQVEHFDSFEMEVEEMRHPRQGPLGERTMSSSETGCKESNRQPLPPRTMQVLPAMADGSLQTFTTKEPDPPTPSPSQPPKANYSYRGRKNVSATGSASNLYWSCGYCTFQSNGQSEIKEHSNKQHPGKPHRYVALIKNMTPDTYIPHGATSSNIRRSTHRPALSTSQTNGARNFLESDEIVPLKERDDSPDLLKVKINLPKRENVIYRCYHCSYTAKRHSALKTHIYHKHRGKGLVAVEDESETGQQMFFCARDDCTFKSDNPGLYLNHVEQCTPWNKPELADVEVEPHIRECLDQTIAFAETAREKVNNQCLSKPTDTRASPTARTDVPGDEVTCISDTSLVSAPSEAHLENEISWELEDSSSGDDLDCPVAEENAGTEKIISQDLVTVNESPGRDQVHPDTIPHNSVQTSYLGSFQGERDKPVESSSSLLQVAALCDDSGHIDASEEEDELQHSISSDESFIPVGLLCGPVSKAVSTVTRSDTSGHETDITGLIHNESHDQELSSCKNTDDEAKISSSSNQTFHSTSQHQLQTSLPDADGASWSDKERDSVQIDTEDAQLSGVEMPEGYFGENVSEKDRDSVNTGEERSAGIVSYASFGTFYDDNVRQRERNSKPVESEWLHDLIDSTSTDNTDSEESTVPKSCDLQDSKAENDPQQMSESSVENKILVKNSDESDFSTASDQIVKCKTSYALEQTQSTFEKPENGADPPGKELPSKLCFSYVPARSSAQKALSKMKSSLEEEGDSDKQPELEARKLKRLPLKTKKSRVKIKALPLLQSKTSLISSCGLSSSAQVSQPVSAQYKCPYCADMSPSSLHKIKTHLQVKHQNMSPTVINCSNKRLHKRCRFLMCPHPTCLKLFSKTEALDHHKNVHLVDTHQEPKEQSNLHKQSSCSTSSSLVQNADDFPKSKLVSPINSHQPSAKTTCFTKQHTPASMPQIRSCMVKLHNMGMSEVQAITQRQKRDGKYLCLYCTEYVYESTLTAMKSHYIQEHEGQLMVMRDTEARRAQLPSRVYVCSSPGCEFKCVSRLELDMHVRHEQHSTSSCSYVYQCGLCGWFSSSHATANQHLDTQHSPDEGACLVHMQVMVDEYGQMSKKIV